MCYFAKSQRNWYFAKLTRKTLVFCEMKFLIKYEISVQKIPSLRNERFLFWSNMIYEISFHLFSHIQFCCIYWRRLSVLLASSLFIEYFWCWGAICVCVFVFLWVHVNMSVILFMNVGLCLCVSLSVSVSFMCVSYLLIEPWVILFLSGCPWVSISSFLWISVWVWMVLCLFVGWSVDVCLCGCWSLRKYFPVQNK